jgi:ELWxxDGT repeat protein
VNGTELWKTDGTAAGTVLVKDINATPGRDPSWVLQIQRGVYFRADDGVHGSARKPTAPPPHDDGEGHQYPDRPEGRLTSTVPSLPASPSSTAHFISAPTTACTASSSGKPTAPPRARCR